jgi:hypothetical protein
MFVWDDNNFIYRKKIEINHINQFKISKILNDEIKKKQKIFCQKNKKFKDRI